jgi:hypothetical protein
MSFAISGVGSLKLVTPVQWRGYVFNKDDGNASIGLTPDHFQGAQMNSNSFDIQIYYNGKWVTPLHIKTNPTFKTTVSSHKGAGAGFDTFSENGWTCLLSGFDNTGYFEAFHQSAGWYASDSIFYINRHNNIQGGGIIAWKLNTVAINPGEVVIFTNG